MSDIPQYHEKNKRPGLGEFLIGAATSIAALLSNIGHKPPEAPIVTPSVVPVVTSVAGLSSELDGPKDRNYTPLKSTTVPSPTPALQQVADVQR
ncbi:MAG: hypothetical protein ACMG6E_02305 [Candidatus Roizmanbacteria bacterium]